MSFCQKRLAGYVLSKSDAVADGGGMSMKRDTTTEDSIPTRGSLLTRLKYWDDQESWKRFYETYWKLIYGVAIKAGLSEAEAKDVVQETVICVARKMKQFKYDPAIGSFKSWLLHLTRWRITDQLRKRQRRVKLSGSAGHDPARTATVERIPDPASLNLDSVWDEQWQQNLMDAALTRVKRKVNAKDYQVFDLYTVKEWPVDDIVRLLKVSPHQVYQVKHRVMALLKKEIEHLEAKMI